MLEISPEILYTSTILFVVTLIFIFCITNVIDIDEDNKETLTFKHKCKLALTSVFISLIFTILITLLSVHVDDKIYKMRYS